MLEDLEKALSCLETGTFPEDRNVAIICYRVAIVFTTFERHAKTTGEPVFMVLIDHTNDEGIPLFSIHDAWSNRVSKDKTVAKFQGVGVCKVTEDIEIYVGYKRLVSNSCSWCKAVYGSDVNSVRCEASHISKRDLSRRTPLSLPGIEAYWDGLDRKARLDLVSPVGTAYVSCIPEGCEFSPDVARLVKIVGGDVDCSGHQLLKGLDEASEHTFSWRLSRPLVTIVLTTRGDYIAAIANNLIKSLAEAQSEDAAQKLLEELDKEPRPVVKKTITKTVAKPVKEAFFRRLERSIFSDPNIFNVSCWADM